MRLPLALAAMLGVATLATAQTIPIPNFTNTFNAQLTRGFWFQAPTNFVIVGLQVPDESLTGVQNVEIVDLGNAAPPAFPSLVTPPSLFSSRQQPSNQIIPCSIPVVQGQFIGILGACGSATMANSYGPTGPFQSSIFGNPVTLTRFGTQFNINTTPGPYACWSEAGGSFCRVDVYIAPASGYATAQPYGTGCYQQYGSWYENFGSAAAFDLGSSSISMLQGGGGYTMLPGVTQFVPPSATAQNLALTDDSQTVVNLSAAFPYPGGSSNTLNVCSNGFLSVGGNGTSFTPSVATMLANANVGWYSWHDYLPNATNNVMFEEVGGTAYVTWNGVPDFGATGSSNTFQFQIELATGNVHLVYQAMSGLGNGHLVGYSPGGPSLDPGNRDISATLAGGFSVGATDLSPINHASSARPVIGTGITLTTGNVPGTAVLGATIFGLTEINPGFDLSAIGAPGCFQYASVDGSAVWFPSGGSGSTAFGIPNNPALAGVQIKTQGAAIVPGVNPLGAQTSNGLRLTLDIN